MIFALKLCFAVMAVVWILVSLFAAPLGLQGEDPSTVLIATLITAFGPVLAVAGIASLVGKLWRAA